MQSMKNYLQPAVTLIAAIALLFIAIDQYRTSNARFACAQVFGKSEGMKKDLSRLGLPKDGNYNNIRGYCRAFINPSNSGRGYASIDFPNEIDVNITDMPRQLIGGSVTIEGNIGADVNGSVSTF